MLDEFADDISLFIPLQIQVLHPVHWLHPRAIMLQVPLLATLCPRLNFAFCSISFLP